MRLLAKEVLTMWTCPNCGANLDNGERCDCENEDRNEADHRIKADVVRYSRAEFAAAMQMCERTLGIRLAQPDTFTLKELRVLAKKLHSTVAELIGETQCA